MEVIYFGAYKTVLFMLKSFKETSGTAFIKGRALQQGLLHALPDGGEKAAQQAQAPTLKKSKTRVLHACRQRYSLKTRVLCQYVVNYLIKTHVLCQSVSSYLIKTRVLPPCPSRHSIKTCVLPQLLNRHELKTKNPIKQTITHKH